MGARLDAGLVNRWQRGFPLCARPFAAIAERCGTSEERILEEFRSLKAEGSIDRVGPVFRPNTVGASSLAAMAVPPERLAQVAALVSDHASVNHNYEREHRYNLWFVATGRSAADVQWTLSCIEYAAGLPVLRLPLVEEYHIDLGFDLDTGLAPRSAAPASRARLDASEQRLAAKLAAGLPLVPSPYAELGVPEAEVIATLGRWLQEGIVRRIGAVVRHRALGYVANAMVVWDVPDERVAQAGRRLAAEAAVTLCYRRARALPAWRYNLYGMVHGRRREATLAAVARMAALPELAGLPHEVLFSRRCFAQRAPRYG